MINQQEWQEMSPYGQYEEVEVTFPSTAHTDIEVPHSLVSYTPEHIDYQIIRQNQPAIVYHDGSATRRAWQKGYIIVRCNIPNAVVTLRLSVRHKEAAVSLLPVDIPTAEIQTSNLLQASVHLDTDTNSATRAATIIGNSLNKWAKLQATASGQFLQRSGDDLVFATTGTSLTLLNASELASGTIPDARFPAVLPALSGANLTNLNASNLASGTVADGRLSANVPLLNAANVFSALQTATSIVAGGSVQTDGLLRTRRAGNNIEFGHTNPSGFVSALGGEAGSGRPFIALNAEHGTNVNTYRTRGNVGIRISTDNAGALLVGTLDNANADNQTPTGRLHLGPTGNLTVSGTVTEQNRAAAMGNWTSYVPVWSSVGGTPVTVGNAVIAGQYAQVGKTVFYQLTFTFGSTSAQGASNVFDFTLPIAADMTHTSIGSGVFLDSGTNFRLVMPYLYTATQIRVLYEAAGGSGIGADVPIAWTTNDSVRLWGTYRAA